LNTQKSTNYEIKSKLNSGSACLSFRTPLRKLKIEVYESVTLNVIFHGCVKLGLRYKRRTWIEVYEKEVLRGTF
jgi:hypothetical protein